MTSMLGWQRGDRLTLTAAASVVMARRDPGGIVTMPSKPYLLIPAPLRAAARGPGAAGGAQCDSTSPDTGSIMAAWSSRCGSMSSRVRPFAHPAYS